MKRAAAVTGAVVLGGVALYVAAMAAAVTLWASLWAVSGWTR